MPIKHNLTRYDVLKDQVRRLPSSGETSYTEADRLLKDIAVIVASFSSGQSWRTHRELVLAVPNFSSSEVREEYLEAKSQKWKNISSFDIGEVAQKSVSQFKFGRWLYYNVERGEQDRLKRAWCRLNEITSRDEDIEEMISSQK